MESVIVDYRNPYSFDDKCLWCRENIGSPGMLWWTTPLRLRYDENQKTRSICEFVFMKSEDAVTFKLRFGN